MAHWHEARPNTMIGRTRIEGGRGSRLIGIVKHPAETGSHFVVYFLRYEGADAATDPNGSATGWAEWWPRDVVDYQSHAEAVDATKATLPLFVKELRRKGRACWRI